MSEDIDKFEQAVHTHLYSHLTKLVAVIGFLVGMGLVFIAHSEPNKPIIADVEVTVKGLVCSSCGIGLKNKFKRHFLVKKLFIDIKTQKVYLDHVSDMLIKSDEIKKMVEDSGYEVSLIKYNLKS